MNFSAANPIEVPTKLDPSSCEENGNGGDIIDRRRRSSASLDVAATIFSSIQELEANGRNLSSLGPSSIGLGSRGVPGEMVGGVGHPFLGGIMGPGFGMGGGIRMGVGLGGHMGGGLGGGHMGGFGGLTGGGGAGTVTAIVPSRRRDATPSLAPPSASGCRVGSDPRAAAGGSRNTPRKRSPAPTSAAAAPAAAVARISKRSSPRWARTRGAEAGAATAPARPFPTSVRRLWRISRRRNRRRTGGGGIPRTAAIPP